MEVHLFTLIQLQYNNNKEKKIKKKEIYSYLSFFIFFSLLLLYCN